MTKRRIAVLAGLAAVVLAILWWRGRGRSDDTSASDGTTSTAKVTTGVPAGVGREIKKPVDPKALARGSVAGTIRDEDTKAPLAGARVCLSGWSRALRDEEMKDPFCATTDAQGAYKIENLYAAEYSANAGAPTYRPNQWRKDNDRHGKSSFKLAGGEAKTGVDITLRKGAAELTGTVSDIGGGPIAKAKVSASSGRWGEGAWSMISETDDKGHYSLWIGPGQVRVSASADGYATNFSVTGKAPGVIDVLLTPESGLSGTVVDARTGAPVDDAQVSVEATQWSWSGNEADRTDAQGKFKVHRIPPGRYVVTARTDHGYGRTEGSVLVGLGQQVDGVIVKVFPAARIIGKVMIEGSPPTLCVEAGVWFRDEANDRWVSATTEDDGTIHADGVLPGSYTVNVSCEGYRAKDKYPPVVVADKDLVDQTWMVESGATIKGRVLTKAGEPIEGARVNAQITGGDVRAKMDWNGDRSQPDGSYELRGVKVAAYKLEVDTDKAVVPRDGFKTEVKTPGETVTKDLVLEDGGTIKGIVVDSQGKPVDDVTVDARPLEDRYWWGGQNEIKSDAKGEFTVEALRPGDYRVTARRGWGEELRKPGTNDDDTQGEKTKVEIGKVATVKLVVESQTGTIKGTVVDAKGEPVSDAFISTARESDAAGAQESGGGRGTRDFWGDNEKPVLTGTDGTFVVTKLSPGKYTLRAYRKGGGEAIAEHVAVGSTTKLQIKLTGSIAGTARATANPQPVELTVAIEDLKSGYERTETFYRTEGAFTITDLPAGHFTITAKADAGQAKTEVDLAENQDKTGIALTLEELVTLVGRVVDLATKAPVKGMMVFARPAVGSGAFSFTWGDDDMDHVSDDAGKFTVKRVPKGKLAIQGMAKEWKESDYTWFRVLKTIDKSGTIDLGDIGVIKKRIKEGEVSGELGLNFKQNPPDADPELAMLEVSHIDPKGPCAGLDIKVGDIITAIDGIDVTGGNTMHGWTLMNAKVGTKLSLTLKRGPTISVTLAPP